MSPRGDGFSPGSVAPDAGVIDPTADFLLAAGAARFRHGGGRTLLDHLIGTREIVRRWRLAPWIQDAAALHSVYGTDVYRERLVLLSDREVVRNAAGAPAEHLAYLFCVVPRRALFEAVAASDRFPDAGAAFPMRLPRELSAQGLSVGDACRLLLIHMANGAEQACDSSGAPGLWLAGMSRMAVKLPPSGIAVPPIFAWCTTAVDADAERRARSSYLAGIAAFADADAAAQQFDQAIEDCPCVAEPMILRAHLALARGQASDARRLLQDASRTLRSLGTAWDKRLTYDRWLSLIGRLDHLALAGRRVKLAPLEMRRPQETLAAVAEDLGASVRERPIEPSIDPDSRLQRCLRYIERFAVDGEQRSMRFYEGLASAPWHDPRALPLVIDLEANFDAIRHEIEQVARGRFRPERERIRRTGSWEVLTLFERGRKMTENCAACPVTTRIVEAHSTIRTPQGLIYVSVMRPGTHIAPHRGPTNMRLRCHLGIEIPDGDCAIRVAGDERRWREGRCLVFDDFYEHEAWNHTNEDRVVLIVDLWHPDLSPREMALLEGLDYYALSYARSLNRYWASASGVAGTDTTR